MSERKAVIKNADMTEDMQQVHPGQCLRTISLVQDAVDCASQALEKYNIEKDIAAYIKKVYHSYKTKSHTPLKHHQPF